MLETPAPEVVERERFEILQQLEDWLEVPLLVLGFVWLALPGRPGWCAACVSSAC